MIKIWRKKENGKKEISCDIDHGDEACMICCHEVETTEKLENLKSTANKVSIHCQKLLASTENLLMHMIQFGFVFPLTLTVFFSRENKVLNTFNNSTISNPGEFAASVNENWTSILIIFSIVSSIISLVLSQTRAYFSSPGKISQKNFKTTAMIFTIIILQVLPKLLASQAFIFGVFGSKLQMPNAILILLLCYPYMSSALKTLVVFIWLTIFNKKITQFSRICDLLLSPFVFTRLQNESENKQTKK